MENFTIYNKIKKLNEHYDNLHSEVGLFDTDNSSLIFSSLKPIERGFIMNLVRDRNVFASKMLSNKELKKRIFLKIKEIINDN